MIRQAAEKAAKEIDDEELEFEPIQKMLQNTRSLITEATKDDNSLMWYELINYTDWTLIVIVTIITSTALFLIVKRCRSQKESELNRVVKSFRKNLQKHINDRKKEYNVPREAPDSEEEAETLELKPMKVTHDDNEV